MPCPDCRALQAPGSSAKALGLKRVRSKQLLPGERLYRCGDCGQLWRTHERDLSVMVPARGTIETTGASVPQNVRALAPARRARRILNRSAGS